MAGEQSFKAVINDTNPNVRHKDKNGKWRTGGSAWSVEITGGSDLTGRPMRPELAGGGIKSVLITAGIGYKGKRFVNKRGKIYRYKYDGLRRRRNLRGNVVSQDTRQINLKITEVGNRSLDAIFGLVDEALPVEEPSGEEE